MSANAGMAAKRRQDDFDCSIASCATTIAHIEFSAFAGIAKALFVSGLRPGIVYRDIKAGTGPGADQELWEPNLFWRRSVTAILRLANLVAGDHVQSVFLGARQSLIFDVDRPDFFIPRIEDAFYG
jgi:hypothetical protein